MQENVFKEDHFDLLTEWMDRNEVDYEVIKFRPFVEDVECNTLRKDIWCWGSVNMARAAKKYGWMPGSMYNDNHDFEVYSKYYGIHMLNHDSIVMKVTDPLPTNLKAFFARPTKDTKAFSGQLFMDYAWNDWVKDMIDSEVSKIFNAETKVLVAPLKTTQQEVRCWIVEGKVITASRYSIGGKVVLKNYDDETFYTDFAQEMADIYCPAEAFVMDVCLSDDELKIVEINCINCSGFYHMNVDKLMKAIELADWSIV